MGSIGVPNQGGLSKYQLVLMVNEGSTVTISETFVTKNFEEKNGAVLVSGLKPGAWKIRVQNGNYSREKDIIITDGEECRIITLYFNIIPDFEYHNLDLAIVDDDDLPISSVDGLFGNWKIRITSINGEYGTIKFHDLKNQYIDIFLVGGGGNGTTTSYAYWGSNGGGGGYTKTIKNFRAEEMVEYMVVVAGPGGRSSFASGSTASNKISVFANPGKDGYSDSGDGYDANHGGDGGSGGAGGAVRTRADSSPTQGVISGKSSDGGSDGDCGRDANDGKWYYIDEDMNMIGVHSYSYGGNGQGYTTKEFGEPFGTLYSPGGAGGALDEEHCGERGRGITGDNSGAGGCGSNPNGYSTIGASGIVIIRNSRDQLGFI